MIRKVTITFTILLMIFVFQLSAQVNLKAIKKEIPRKGIKNITASPLSDHLFVYHSKTDTGLWDSEAQRILLTNFTGLSACSTSKDWIEFESADGNGICDIVRRKTLFTIKGNFKLQRSIDTSFVLIISPDYLGMIDLKFSSAYTVDMNDPPKENIIFREDSGTYESAAYEADYKSLAYNGKFNDGVQYTLTLKHEDVFLFEISSLFNTETRVYKSETGDFVDEVKGRVKAFHKGYYTPSYYTSYYDKDFKILYKNLFRKEFKPEHLQFFTGLNVTEAEYIERDIYKYKADNQYGFFSINGLKIIGDQYDDLIFIGYNIYLNGQSFYTSKEGKYGLYHSQKGELLKPKYDLIEFRAFYDGTFGYRADNDFYRIILDQYGGWNNLIPEGNWSDELSSKSSLIHYLLLSDGKLHLSLRRSEPDVHDFYYGTNTLYNTGSGVYDQQSKEWIIKPEYHTLTPYKGYYIALKPPNNILRYNDTEILDKDFKPITKEKFGASFIYNNMLITRNEKWQLILYDVEKNKTSKVLGKLSISYEDFRFNDGYLFIGHNNFDSDKNIESFDIVEIITPDGSMIDRSGIAYKEYIADGLVIVAQIPGDTELETSNLYLGKFSAKKKSLYDLKTGKQIIPWNKTVYFDNNTLTYWKGNEPQGGLEKVPVDKLRDHFNLD